MFDPDGAADCEEFFFISNGNASTNGTNGDEEFGVKGRVIELGTPTVRNAEFEPC